MDRLHLPLVLRLSMYGQPVAAEQSSDEGKSPEGKRVQTEEEQRFGFFCESKGTDDPPRGISTITVMEWIVTC